MKQKLLVLFNLFSSLALLLSLVGIPVVAQEPEPPGGPPEDVARRTFSAPAAPGGGEYLLVLPLPRVDPANLLPGLSLEQARTYARGLIRHNAQSYLEKLTPLKERGVIADFQIDAEQNTIRIRGVSSVASDELQKLPGLLQTSKQEAPCETGAAREIEKQVVGFSLVQYALLASPQVPDTDPSIHAYVLPGSDWTYVMGKTTASTPVSLKIYRGDRLIASQNTISEADGDYWFYPEWNEGCGEIGYSWMLQVGDLVEVSAHSNAVSTTITYLDGWVDPEGNSVIGYADVGRLVEVNLYAYTSDLCSPPIHYINSAPTDELGNYLVNFTDQVDFNGTAYSQVYAKDENGNSTFASFYASRLVINADWSDFWGYLPPLASFYASLSRDDVVIDSYVGSSDPDGYYWGFFTNQTEPGDLITVQALDIELTFTVANFLVTFNASTDEATGVTAPNSHVQADFEKNVWSWPITSCSRDSECVATDADGSGDFTLTTSTLDLVRGDHADFYVYDSQGNYQYVYRNFTAIYASLSYPNAFGYWFKAFGYWSKPSDRLIISLKDSRNILVERNWDSWLEEDGYFDVWFSYEILPTDHIEVSNGVITETMTVQNLTATLDSSTQRLTGNAPNTLMLVDLSDYNRNLGDWENECRSFTVSEGAFNQDYSTRNFGATTYADIFSQGPDEHYTYRYAHAFKVEIYSGDSHLWGWTKSPYEVVNMTVHEGTSVYDNIMTSFSDGYFEFHPTDTPLYPGAGVLIDAGQDADIIVPSITFNIDTVNNRVYGHAPANQPLELHIEQRTFCGKGWTCFVDIADTLAFADAAENYTFALDGINVYDGEHGCRPASARCTISYATYYSPEEHVFYYDGPYPPDVPSDAYEPDDTPDTATPYAGLSSHTFTLDSGLDWISFEVTSEMVGKPLLLQTLNLGETTDTVLDLYASDGTTLLAYNDDYGNSYRSLLVWTPPAVGSYYVRIYPPGTHLADGCGTSYDFFIITDQVYLPMISR